jgi:hypothetical protein
MNAASKNGKSRVVEPKGAQLIVPNGDRKRSYPMGRGILLWLLGVPIPVIIILLLVFHH